MKDLRPGERSLRELDEVDRKLLRLLSEDARRTNASLASELGIAQSTCLARLNALRASHVIRGFTVDVEPGALGHALQALVFVRIRPGARHLMSEFGRTMREVAGVTQVFFLGGDEDFLLHVSVRDAQDVRDFVVEHLSAHPAVANTRTSLVFEHLRGAEPWG
ncbi:MAG: Lrp/AsnC family transcriptional regulator [Arthrobacter sp.]|nr:Lrp/AsnC family transcriptional regulator [Arthrobacter sp.]